MKNHKNFCLSIYTLLLILTFSNCRRVITVERFDTNPIITPEMIMNDDGENINGPSLIKVPDFISNPLGKYYLYFSHHAGEYIRLAYSDYLQGPWKIYEPGTLKMKDCKCADIPNGPPNHIASPDVHVDIINQKIVMYFHCPAIMTEDERVNFAQDQITMRSTSHDGLSFTSEDEILGDSYFRVFEWKDFFYAISLQGQFYRSKDGVTGFEKGNNPFLEMQDSTTVRHSAVLIRNNTLYVFYSRMGDTPERILLSKIDLNDKWTSWTPSVPITVLEPELDYEGGSLKLEKSIRGVAHDPVRQLRDPAIYEEDGEIYLLYSVQGEKGIAIAKLNMN
ncbi:hypothetical protein [Algoriphagus sp.]|uniref:hypothetical protein n=1 Tax=Algoriphagus sp. TaxID=1872435 RepID=UPI0025D0B6F6|nr:hypothetical protein [Algoriphagus sp.]